MTNTLNITMDPHTVEELSSRGMHLYAFKAVQGGQGAGGQPLVWFRTDAYSLDTEIRWETNYKAYCSLNDLVPGGRVHASGSFDAELGEVFTITGNNCTGEVSGDGDPRFITIRSAVMPQRTCGLSQKNDDASDFAPICAFPINLNFADYFTPIEKVLVIFSTDTIDTGTVIAKMLSPGVLVDFTGVTERSVSFDIVKGWDCDGGTYCQLVLPEADLVSLLIEPSAAIELARVADIANGVAKLVAL